MSLPCAFSLAWISALVGGLATREDDLATSMVLFFVLLIFVIIGLLRTYQGRSLFDILIVFTPTLVFVFCLAIWSGIRAHLSNLAHSASPTSMFDAQSTLMELVAANGLIGCLPMLLCETTFQVFGLLSKRIVASGRKWVRYTAYTARLMNLVGLVMTVVGTCDLASYLTAWMDQSKLAAVLSNAGVESCATTVLGRDLTILPLMADGLGLVVLLVLTILMVCLRLRYHLAAGVVVHVIAIQCCLAFHFAWKCVRDWAALQVYLDGRWDHATDDFQMNRSLSDLARRNRKQAEEPTLFYLLGIVPLVLAMILVYALDLYSYTNPPPSTQPTQDHLATRFHLFLDPTFPRIELLPTSAKPNTTAKSGAAASDAKKDAGAGTTKGGGKGKEAEPKGEMYLVKRGWLGGWSVQPAKKEAGFAAKAKTRLRKNVQRWVLGWSGDVKVATIAV